jgi:capsular exopolysaccharide synthesis family protein
LASREATAVAPARPAAKDAAAKDAAPKLHEFSTTVREKLVVGTDALPVMREQFRKVAAALYGLRETREIRILMIVSAVPGEGKTLTATNLALTLSESYRCRVLLVDGDLRRPNLHNVFEVPAKPGLKEVLDNDPDAPLPTIPVSSHLELLTAGSTRTDPMGVLTSERMRDVMKRAANEFDWIVLDTPPVELLPDATILANLADAAILVVEAAATKCELARRAIESVGRDRMVGVILNQLADQRDVSEYSYYGYYGTERQDAAQQ